MLTTALILVLVGYVLGCTAIEWTIKNRSKRLLEGLAAILVTVLFTIGGLGAFYVWVLQHSTVI